MVSYRNLKLWYCRPPPPHCHHHCPQHYHPPLLLLARIIIMRMSSTWRKVRPRYCFSAIARWPKVAAGRLVSVATT